MNELFQLYMQLADALKEQQRELERNFPEGCWSTLDYYETEDLGCIKGRISAFLRAMELIEDLVGKVFINFSNHPSDKWSDAQRYDAENHGEIIDVPFPEVPADPHLNLDQLARESVDRIFEAAGDKIPVVLVQGEMTLVYSVVSSLKKKGITCLAAISDRKVEEKTEPDGTTKKVVTFEFKGFRSY